MKTTKVIALWLDKMSNADGPEWIVSRETMDRRGNAGSTRTVARYSENDYADALAHAQELAVAGKLCVIQTFRDVPDCIYQPEGAINPLA